MGDNVKVVETCTLLTTKYAIASSSFSGSASSLYVLGEDGVLRVHQAKEDPLRCSRPVYDAGTTFSQFSKKREAVCGLRAVPEWNALFSRSDGSVQVHPLSDPSRPGTVLPASQGCRDYCASALAGLVVFAQRASFSVFAWKGAAAGSGSSGGGAAATSAPGPHCLQRLSTHTLARATDTPSDLAVVSVQALSPTLVSATIVHRASINWALRGLQSTAGEGEGGAPAAAVAAVAAGAAGEVGVHLPKLFQPFGGRVEERSGSSSPTGEGSPPSATSTGYAVSYLLVHALSGALVRVVRGGVAPPLDATGRLLSPAAAATATASQLGDLGESSLASLASLAITLGYVAPPPASAAASSFSWGFCTLSQSWRGQPSPAPTLLVSSVMPTAGASSDSVASLVFEVQLERGAAATAAATAVEGSEAEGEAQQCSYCGAWVPEDGCVCSALPAEVWRSTSSATQQAQQQGEPPIFLEEHPLPLALLASPSQPLLFAAHAGGVDVFSLCSGELLQAVAIPGVLGLELVQPAGSAGQPTSQQLQHHVLVTARTGLVLLRALPVIEQVANMHSARPKHFLTELALCQLSAATSLQEGGISASRAATIRAEYGYHKLSSGEFYEALAELALARVPVAKVLALFPALLPSARQGEGGPPSARPSSLPLPPSFAPRAQQEEAAHSPISASAAAGSEPHLPELGGGSTLLLPRALSALAVHLARAQDPPSTPALDAQLLEALLWLRNHHRASGQGDKEGRLQAAIHWCVRTRGARLQLEAARGLLVAYGLAYGAGGSPAQELSLLYRSQGLLVEAVEVLALELEGGGLGEGEGEGELDSEGGQEEQLALEARRQAPLTSLLQQLEQCSEELQQQGEEGRKASAGLLQRVLCPLLVGGAGLTGTLLALQHCSTCLPVQQVLLLLQALHPLPTAAATAFSPSTAARVWCLSGEAAQGWGEADPAAYAGVERLALSPGDYIRQVRLAYLEAHWYAAPDPAAAALQLLGYYWEVLGRAAEGGRSSSSSSSPSSFAPRQQDEPPGLAHEYRARALRVLQWGSLSLPPPTPASAASLLSALPAGLWEERAALHGLLGQHTAGLGILLGPLLGDLALAEAYCQRHASAFEMLVQVATEQGRLQAVIPLLTAHVGALSAGGVAAAIPADTPLAGSLAGFLEAALQRTAYAARLACAERGTSSVARVRAQRQLVSVQEKRYKVVDRKDACAVCGRRLGVVVGGGGEGAEVHRPAPLALLARTGEKVHAACLAAVGK